MPSYDNIVDAYSMTVDGSEYTVALDNAGATNQTNEDTYIYTAVGVWAKIDLSIWPVGEQMTLNIQVQKTGGDVDFEPAMWGILVGDPTWDVTSPDFSKLEDMNSVAYVTEDDGPVGMTIKGGLYYYNADGWNMQSANGIFYFRLTDNSIAGTSTGQALVTYSITGRIPYISDPTVEINTTAGDGHTVSVSSGCVVEDQCLLSFDSGTTRAGGEVLSMTDADWTFRISGDELPPAGRYSVYVKAKYKDNYPTIGGQRAYPYIQVRRKTASEENYTGVPFQSIFPVDPATGVQIAADTMVVFPITDIEQDVYPTAYDGPAYIPVLSTDTLEFCFYGQRGANASRTSEWTICQVIWFQEISGGTSAPEIAMLDIPELPEGATDFDTLTVIGGDSGSKDVVVTSDYTAYVAFTESSGLASPNNIQMTMWKCNNAGTWSLVSSDPTGKGTFTHNDNFGLNHKVCQGLCLATDGEDVWLAFGMTDGTTTAGKYNWKIYVRKYDVSANTWSDVGSGFRKWTPSTYAGTAGSWGAGMCSIKISPAGVPWVVFGEPDPSTDYAINWQPIAFYFDGSSWVDAELPLPVDPNPTSPKCDIASTSVNYYHKVDLTFCQHDGVNENPSVVYQCIYRGTGGTDPHGDFEWYYYEYDGTPGSWSNEIKFTFYDLYPDIIASQANEEWAQGFRLVNSNGQPYLFAGIGLDGSAWGAYGCTFGNGSAIALKGTGSNAPQRPLDGVMWGWSDPTSIDACVDNAGNIWLGSDSFNWFPSSFIIYQPKDDGTGGGSTLASRWEDGVGNWWDNASPNRMFAIDDQVYALTTGDSNAGGDYTVMLYRMSRSIDPYVPWRYGGPINLTGARFRAYQDQGF